jgi:hypothetical protein
MTTEIVTHNRQPCCIAGATVCLAPKLDVNNSTDGNAVVFGRHHSYINVGRLSNKLDRETVLPEW